MRNLSTKAWPLVIPALVGIVLIGGLWWLEGWTQRTTSSNSAHHKCDETAVELRGGSGVSAGPSGMVGPV